MQPNEGEDHTVAPWKPGGEVEMEGTAALEGRSAAGQKSGKPDEKASAITCDLKELRSAAKIEYLGSFANGVRPQGEAPPSIAAAASSAAAGLAEKDEGTLGPGAMAASPVLAAPSTASMDHAASTKKGIEQK